MKKEKWIYNKKWLTFYFTKAFELTYQVCGYFDNRPRINICLFFFRMAIILPFRNNWENECDMPKWGISYHHQTLWFHLGGKGNMNGGSRWWSIYMPWVFDWVRTSNLRKDGLWENETRKSKKELWRDKWKDVIWNETYPYTYVLNSGVVQYRFATVKVVEMEWRWYWFKWLNFPKKVKRSIDVKFNDEVGEGTGSWKGGAMGLGYELLEGETPLECLRRMEKERNL